MLFWLDVKCVRFSLGSGELYVSFKVVVITSSVAKITFVVAEITLKMAVITSSVVKITFEKWLHSLAGND